MAENSSLNGYEKFIKRFLRHAQRNPYEGYQVDVQVEAGSVLSSGEIEECTRTVSFRAASPTGQPVASYTVSGIRYDSMRELLEDQHETAQETIDSLTARLHPEAELTTENTPSGFYIKGRIATSSITGYIVPQRVGMTSAKAKRAWIREFHQKNDLPKPKGLSNMKKDEINSLYQQIRKEYDIRSSDIQIR